MEDSPHAQDARPAAPAAETPRISLLREAPLDARALEAALKGRVKGEVRFDPGSRALYATDASNYRQVPIGVVIPRDLDDVVATVAVCRAHGAPLLSRGGGTSLAGQCCNVAVVLDFSKYLNQVLAIDAEKRLARVQPGTILDSLRALAERDHLTFGPDPATHTHCTLGGMLGNDSCGVHSVMAGRTADNVESLEILTYDGVRLHVGRTSEEELERLIAGGGRVGEIYARLKELRDRYAELIRARFPKIPRRVSGYGLEQLLPENGFHVARALVGSEATCVTILEATLNLVHSPPHRTLVVLGYPDVFSAGDHVPEVLASGPIGCEGLDDCLIADERQMNLHTEDLHLLPEGAGWLVVEFGGESPEEATRRACGLVEALRAKPDAPHIRVYEDREVQARLWKIRESGLGATAWVPGQRITWPGWEDSAVPVAHVGAYLRDFRRMLEKYGYHGSLYGHFGDGCIHISIDFDLASRAGIDHYLAFIDEMADIVVGYGGSLSGEHGDGQARGALLEKMYGPELVEAFREFKAIWDPQGRMNPGKLIDAAPPDANLRLGERFRPWEPETHFRFPEDHASFGDAALRCVGVGECRRLDGGTMCPSFMVTREEQHSTRGRAHLLFEMLHGDPLKGGWQEEAVKSALDLCLACKGCKGDCPVNVDMATYKAEFLSHYYEGHFRPLTAYTLGLIPWWARLASRLPTLANALTQTPGLARVAKALGGIAPQRTLPRFAPETFQAWFARRAPHRPGGPRVILWPDTFNNHFTPAIAQAAVRVLEAAGWQVIVPRQALCCGRPLYDYGFLDLAKRMLATIMETLGDEIDAGVPIVGLEPSCVAVFRDELRNLYPHDERARRLAEQTFVLSEFLTRFAPAFDLPALERPALLQGHCHHKAVMKLTDEKQLLARLGLDCTDPDAGCCGMAGAFGFEAAHHDVSCAIGERKLLPAVRQASPETLILADGFSCREQIAQGTGKRALHLAEAIELALREAGRLEPAPEPPRRQNGRAAWLVVGALGLGALAWAATRPQPPR